MERIVIKDVLEINWGIIYRLYIRGYDRMIVNFFRELNGYIGDF